MVRVYLAPWAMLPGVIREAASVVLLRPGPGGEPLLFWVQRAASLRFFARFHAFPGGAAEPGDASASETAVRETEEETRLRLDAATLVPAGRWVTPPFSTVRFDTRFFLAVPPAGQEPEVLPGELQAGAWITAADALHLWREDRALLAAPTLKVLEVLAAAGAGDPRDRGWLAALAARLEAASPSGATREERWGRRIECHPGVFVHPVRTPTLPPATHTNVVVFGCGRELVVVDPGASDPGEQAALFAFLDELVDEGRRVREVVLTHFHHDHVGGAGVLSDRYQAPIAAHPLTADALRGVLEVDRLIAPEELIDLPADRAGAVRARRLRLVHTPGHTQGHLVLREETTGAVAAGDLVAEGSFIVVDPPEGDMAAYLESLRRVGAVSAGALGIPAHGSYVGDLGALCSRYVTHRLEREGKVLEAVERGAATLEAVVAAAYADTPRELWPLASRSALAHLKKLADEGRVPALPAFADPR